jgi:hypothetical protein
MENTARIKHSFEQAKALIQLVDPLPMTQKEYTLMIKKGLLPDTLVIRPEYSYANKGWAGWKDYLGFKYFTYLELKTLAIKSNIKSMKEYIIFFQHVKHAPHAPSIHYKEWESWSEFLNNPRKAAGKKGLFNVKQAQAYLQKLSKPPLGQRHYRELYNAGRLNKRMPSDPSVVYSIGWSDFLDNGRIRQFNLLPYEDAKSLVSTFWPRIKSSTHYTSLFKDRQLPKGLPCAPNQAYNNKGWQDWYNFLDKKKPLIN